MTICPASTLLFAAQSELTPPAMPSHVQQSPGRHLLVPPSHPSPGDLHHRAAGISFFNYVQYHIEALIHFSPIKSFVQLISRYVFAR